jgi:hypothetical protein
MSKKPPKNALSHGLYSPDTVVLEWENKQEFIDLHESIRQDLDPEGPLQEAEVFEIARLHWIKQRLLLASQLEYRHHPNASDLAEAGKDGWSGINQHLSSKMAEVAPQRNRPREVASSYLEGVRNLMEYVRRQTSMATSEDSSTKPADENLKQAQRATIQDLVELTKSYGKMGERMLAMAPLLVEIIKDRDRDIVECVYRPDLIAKNLKIGAEVDKALEKAMARFFHLKAFQNLGAVKPKMKQVNAIQPPANETIENKKADRPN